MGKKNLIYLYNSLQTLCSSERTLTGVRCEPLPAFGANPYRRSERTLTGVRSELLPVFDANPYRNS
jgi:hypothetical protein